MPRMPHSLNISVQAMFLIMCPIFCLSAQANVGEPLNIWRKKYFILQDVPSIAKTASVDQITATHLEAARRLIQAAGLKASIQSIINDFAREIAAEIVQDRPGLKPDLDSVINDLKPEFDHQVDEIVDLCAHVYASLLPEDDILTIVAFYNSDAGVKYKFALSIGEKMINDSGEAWKKRVWSTMMTRVMQKMEEKGHKF